MAIVLLQLVFVTIVIPLMACAAILVIASFLDEDAVLGNIHLSRVNSSSWHFVAIGDWYHNQESIDTLKNISSGTDNLAFVLGLGDYFYYEGENQTELTEGRFKDVIRPLNLDFKLTLGDHDIQLSEVYKKLFKIDNWTYSFRFREVQFVSLNTEESLMTGTAQYNFLTSQLDRAQNDPDIQWIVIFMHKPVYASKAPLGPDLSIVTTLHPLFDRYSKVALILNGHNHIYQRTYPIMFNHLNPYFPFVMSNNTHDYFDPCGQIYTTVGTGGAELIANEDSPPYIYATEIKYGYLDIEVEDGSALYGRFYPTFEDGNYTDHFTLSIPNSSKVQKDCQAKQEQAEKNTDTPVLYKFNILVDELASGGKYILWINLGNNITKATYIDSSNYNHTEKQTFHFPYENLDTGDKFKACILQVEDFGVTCKEGIFDDSAAETTISFTIS